MESDIREYLHFDPKETPLPRFQGLVQGAVGPRPIAFASTVDTAGRPNLSPFSFFNVFGMNPPLLIFSPSRRGRDNTTKHTFENVKEVPEVVINVVSFGMVQQVSDASAEFPKGVNEFEMVGFTMEPSDLVKPFRVKESPVQFECRVMQVIETGTQGGAGNLVICEILRMHLSPEILNEKGRIDPHKIDLVGRLGGNFYVRASGDALFEIQKPD
jgi:flavin reductase (DIM6/NTAB) family NADH-FMN oxidoreductase RutF